MQGGLVIAPNTPFLTAEWRWLVMLNFAIPCELVQPLVPRGTELDHWHGETIASLVGFRFLRTRVCGCAVPFHQNFDEVNLRFYVRRRVGTTWRRGVVFVKEIVPRRAIAAVARYVYNERYIALPMRHSLPPQPLQGGRFEFAWRVAAIWTGFAAETSGSLETISDGTEAEFILEHYWGYSRQRDGGTMEYAVEHSRWRAWQVKSTNMKGDSSLVYGAEWREPLAHPPRSAFVAEGSPVLVRRGVRC